MCGSLKRVVMKNRKRFKNLLVIVIGQSSQIKERKVNKTASRVNSNIMPAS